MSNEIVDSRESVYGEKVETHRRIAEVWSGILGQHVNPSDVPLMMVGLKLVRTQICPDYSDNSDDVDGYMDIFRAVIGDDMVHARTVDQYLEQKATAAAPEMLLPEGPVTEGLLSAAPPICRHCDQPRNRHDDDGRCRPEPHWGYSWEPAP
jgi:hypothetical protein